MGRNNKQRILYCSYSQIPSCTANSIAVIKQCVELDKISQLKVVLIKGDLKMDYADIYGKLDLDMILLPRLVNRFNSLGLRLFTAAYALIHRPDMVYTRDVFVSRALNCFHIENYYEMHQLDQESERFDRNYKKALFSVSRSKYTKRIICISNSLKKECVDFGVDSKKIDVLHSGVDLNSTDSLSFLKSDYFSNGKPLAVYTGSLSKGKGADIVVRMSELTKDYNFLIVGGKCGDVRQSDNLRHIPWVPQRQVRSIIIGGDYLIMPTELQRYKFNSPLKLFEYMASGKAIIASDIECVREVIVHCKNGMLAQAGNPESFLEQIKLLTDKPELYHLISINALSDAEKYTWTNRAKHILNYLKMGDISE